MALRRALLGWFLPLTGFLEPGARSFRYLVAPGSRNHGSELTDDWGDLNAYDFFIF